MVEVVVGFAVFTALLSAFASWRWLRLWQEAEERLAEAEIEKLLHKVAADYWRAVVLKDRCAVPKVGTFTTADLHRNGVRVARFWLN